MLVRPYLLQRTTHQCLRPPTLTTSRYFHPSPALHDDTPNHYDTLNVPTNASPSEIKKQFYTLSKSHHPDLHPSDPDASTRFVRISEAYATLSSPDKRARYDRDLFRSQPQNAPSSSSQRSGSYSSASTPAGGRPASGLSRRRTQFRGPPPSFYRSGGWGAQSEKRAEHAEKASHAYEGGASTAPGTGPGGLNNGVESDVPHFDHIGHYATHSSIERTRHKARRRAADATRMEAAEEHAGTSTGWGFFMLCGVLGATVGVPIAVGKALGEDRGPGRRVREGSRT